MDLRRNSLLYSLPIVMFVVGIFIGTAVSIWRSAYLYKQTICYLPAVHLQIKQAGFPSGFLKYVCRLRLPVFLMIAVSALTNAAPAAFAAIAFNFWCISSSCNHISNDAFWHHRNIAGSGSFSAALYLLHFWILGTLRASL